MPFAEGTPTVEVTLDKARTLGFTMGAMRRIKARLGTLAMPALEDGTINQDKAVEWIPVVVWACLDAEGRAQLTVEQVEDLIHPGNVKATSRAVVELFNASAPDAAQDPTEAVPVAEPATATST